MRSGPRLECAAAQQVGPGFPDSPGGFYYLLLAFHRARDGGNHWTAPLANLQRTYPNQRSAGMEIAGHQLVRFGNMDYLLHPRQVPDGGIIHITLVPQDADGGSFASRDRCRLE